MTQLGLFDRTPPEPEAPSFHVRSHVTVSEAEEGERRAQRQEDLLLEWFRSYPDARPTPSELWMIEICKGWPLTSVRRALSNLTRAGYLVHYKADRRPGPYGANESCWGLRT